MRQVQQGDAKHRSQQDFQQGDVDTRARMGCQGEFAVHVGLVDTAVQCSRPHYGDQT